MRKFWFDEMYKTVIRIGLGFLLGSLLMGCHANVVSLPSATRVATFELLDTSSAPLSNSPTLSPFSTPLPPCAMVLETAPEEAKPSGKLYVKWIDAPYWKRIDLASSEELIAGANPKVVSPNGQWGAYIKEGPVFLVVKSLKGDGVEYQISLEEQAKTFEEAQKRILWVNDTMLQVQFFERDGANTRDRFILASLLNGETETVELHEPEMYTDELGSILAVSPDLRRLAYIASGGTGDTFQLVLWDRETQRQLIVIRQSTPYPMLKWSPNGQNLAYLRRTITGEEIVVINSDGKELNAIKMVGGVGAITWSPDGEKLAFVHFNEREQYQLAVWEIGTGTIFSPCIFIQETPILAWSLDNRYLAVSGMTDQGIQSKKYQTFIWDLEQNWVVNQFYGRISQLDWR